MAPPAASREHVAAVLRDVLATILPEVPPSLVTGDKHLRDLGADSVDRVEIVLSLMERLHVDQPMSSFSDVPHIDALIELLAGIGRP